MGENVKNPEKLTVCARCLMAIESHEGRQTTRTIYLDDEDTETTCDWCGDTAEYFDTLYEIQ